MANTEAESDLGLLAQTWRASICLTADHILSPSFPSRAKRTTSSGTGPFRRQSVMSHSRRRPSKPAGSTFPPLQHAKPTRRGSFFGNGHAGGKRKRTGPGALREPTSKDANSVQLLMMSREPQSLPSLWVLLSSTESAVDV
jgi:hypothetical protein